LGAGPGSGQTQPMLPANSPGFFLNGGKIRQNKFMLLFPETPFKKKKRKEGNTTKPLDGRSLEH
jgi:hypothetical protein